MKINIVETELPKSTLVFLKSEIRWGHKDKTEFKFEIEGDKISMVYDVEFSWADGGSFKELKNYIIKKEVEYSKSRENLNRVSEERNKIRSEKYEKAQRILRKWKDENWVCMEGGDGYYDWKGYSEFFKNEMKCI